VVVRWWLRGSNGTACNGSIFLLLILYDHALIDALFHGFIVWLWLIVFVAVYVVAFVGTHDLPAVLLCELRALQSHRQLDAAVSAHVVVTPVLESLPERPGRSDSSITINVAVPSSSSSSSSVS
jgi:hypothetical protein